MNDTNDTPPSGPTGARDDTPAPRIVTGLDSGHGGMVQAENGTVVDGTPADPRSTRPAPPSEREQTALVDPDDRPSTDPNHPTPG